MMGFHLPVRRRFENLFRMLDPFEDLTQSAVDVYQEGNEVVVKADLPGFKKEEISIHLENGVLSLEAVRETDEEVSERDYYRKERRSVHFRESIALPAEVDAKQVSAKLRDGVLDIRLPRIGPSKTGTTIEID
ncbi:MAG: Hsp20/alpha crystallin family protein [Candidatus Desulforudis sp.]|nr:Hsp20/alpha crystallin family protein [Desulforudis sp.]